MSGTVAIEAQLNGIVKEYLDLNGFDSTLDCFNDECVKRGKSILEVDKKMNSLQKGAQLLNEFMSLFMQGERKEFFRKWNENIPASRINEDLYTQKLEFELNLYFATFPFSKRNKDSNVQSKESMNAFKEYIENKGRVVCQTKEFLPYFGLPYHHNPPDGFPELFTEEWFSNVKQKLQDFLKQQLDASNQSKLLELYSKLSDTNNTVDDVQKLKQQLIESEKRTMAFMRKFNRVQADYHNLIGITAELVDSLENTISGKPVSSEYIQNICYKLFNTQLKQTVDFTRPGTAGDYIRKSLAYQKLNNDKVETRNLPPLDYVKIKHDLIHQNEKRQICILQALRWRLTKAETIESRQRILTSYIAGDILNCRSEKQTNSIIDLLKSKNDTIKQFMARLINAFASLNHGRSYLASSSELIKSMLYVLRMEKDDTFTKKNLLAALQKLSLRQKLQLLMINENAVDYLVTLLEEHETLSDYSLEYAVALFMNLTLKSAGKKKCINHHKRIIKVASDLLCNSTNEVQRYLNGSLFNILLVPEIKAYAKTTNLIETLKNYSAEEDEMVYKQRQFIIGKLSSDEDNQDAVPGDENEEDEDEDDEEDAEMMEIELDSGEFIMKQSEELVGEQLLLNKYSLNNNKTNGEPSRKSIMDDTFNENSTSVLKRPITPLHLRNSQLIQSKQFTETVKPDKPMNTSKLASSQSIVTHNQKTTSTTSSTSKFSSINKENRTYNTERKSISKNSLTNISKLDEPLFGKKETNVLVIESNDVDEILLADEPPNVNKHSSVNKYSSKLFAANDSVEVFANRPKIQRTPDQSGSINKKKSTLASNMSGSSFLPKYSIAEPRPSSSSSSRSRNSPNSSSIMPEDSLFNSNFSKKK